MKKLFVSVMAVAGLLLSASCSVDEKFVNPEGDEALVSFTTELPGSIQTRAISDGTTATNLIVGVYDKDLNYLNELRKTATFEGKNATVTFKLAKGKTYNFIFWAQAAEDGQGPYTISDLKNIQVSYEGALANDETRDAFLAVYKNFKVTGSFTEDITLKRPFAQLNFFTSEADLEAAKKSNLVPKNSIIKLAKAATVLHPFTNTVSGETEAEVVLASNKLPADDFNFTKTIDENVIVYKPLGTAYFLVDAGTEVEETGKDEAMLNYVGLQIEGAEGEGITANNVPARWNYRTNIYGDLLTSEGTFNVEIEEGFDDPAYDHEYEQPVMAKKVADIADLIENGKTNIVIDEAPEAAAEVVLPAMAYTKPITMSIPASDHAVTFKYAAENQVPENVNINMTGETEQTGALNINLPESHVTLNGGDYDAVTAAVSATTLVIEKDVTIETLTMTQGNVEIYGTVETVTELPEGCKVTKYEVADAAAFEKALALNAETVALRGAVTLEKDVTLPKALNALELNGNTLTATSLVLAEAEDVLAVSNGTLELNATKSAIQIKKGNTNFSLNKVVLNAPKAYNEALRVCDNDSYPLGGCTVNVEESNITVGNEGQGISLRGINTLNVKNTTITHDYIGITQNGTYAGSTVTVTNCTIKGPKTGIYLSNSKSCGFNTLTVEGGSITSTDMSAIEVKKTNITVKNAHLISGDPEQAYKVGGGSAEGNGYAIVLAGYVEGTPYEGTYTLEGNTYSLAAGTDVRAVYKYAGKPITTAAELKEYLNKYTAAGSGNASVNIEMDITLNEGETWTPVKIDSYNGAGYITVNGNGYTIKGLSAPLFAGGFAGASGIIINDLTIADSQMVSDNTLGSGAFVETIDSMQEITLKNCHFKNSTLTGSRTGGLIGWNSGYNDTNNGAVKTYVNITNCSVVECEITGAGTVGGIVGHAGGNAWTYNNIDNCIVKDCKLTSNDDSYRVGVVVGTANVGEVTISDITQSGNTLKQIYHNWDNADDPKNGTNEEIARPDGRDVLYGRVSFGDTGKLTINGTAVTE